MAHPFFEIDRKNMFKKSKFKIDQSEKGKKKRTFQGRVFDSEMELKYYRDYLLPLQERGVITRISLQPRYMLQEKFVKNGKVNLPINYVADYEVEYADGRVTVVDIKGLPTQEAKLKRKVFDYVYPDKTLEWIALSIQDGGWIQYDDLVKLRRERKKKKGKK